jgi:LacI family transcriptional regulator
VKEQGYRSSSSRKRRSRESLRYISIIAHAADNEYIGNVVRGMLDQLEITAYQGVLHLTDLDPQREAQYVRLAQDIGSDGILLITPRLTDVVLNGLIVDGTPFVLIDAYPEHAETPWVRCTNWQGAREATNYLISLGHRRIGFIGGRRGDNITEAREHGYRSALVDAGIPFDPTLVSDGDYTKVSGSRAMAPILQLEELPTALLVCADLMAIGVMQSIAKAGLRVPEDISIIGFDDLPSAANLSPPLTTVRQSLYEMGRMAAQMVVALARDEELVSQQVELPTRLITRESCCPPR